MGFKDLAADVLEAPLALLLGMGIFHMLLEVVDVHHLWAYRTFPDVSSAVGEVAVDLGHWERLSAVLAVFNGLHRCELLY